METNLFGEVGSQVPPPYSHPSRRKPKKRSSGYRKADLVLNRQNILRDLEFTDSPLPIPMMHRVDLIDLPTEAITFSKAVSSPAKSALVVFYEADVNFARILNNPRKYISILKKFPCIVAPDFSQKIGMNKFVCFSNSWWNKALGAFFQRNDIIVIPNVTWSSPASYRYAFLGIPKHSVIAINCTGIKGNHAAMYLWRKGYEEALKVLEPTLIIRYGDKMPGEREDISVYYENINLKNLRNGRKRISC